MKPEDSTAVIDQTSGQESVALSPRYPIRLWPLYFAGIFLFYFSLSPGVFRSMGYMEEEVAASKYLLARAGLYTIPEGTGWSWPRNGVLALGIHLPFLLMSGPFVAEKGADDLFLSLEPVLLSAGIATLIFVWTKRLTGSDSWAFMIATVSALCSMLWPYAYIGLETQQAMFVLASAFLALQERRSRSWPWALLFAFCCAMSLSSKSTGAILIPPIAFLIWVVFRSDKSPLRVGREHVTKLLVTCGIVGVSFLIAYSTKERFWILHGGTRDYIAFWMVEDPVSYLINLVAFIASPNKGLFVFAPITLLGALVVPRVYRTHRELALFAILTIGSLVGAFSLLACWSDENWGPRYLTTAIGPLAICFAASRGEGSLRLKKEAPLIAVAVLGLAASFLGAFYSYGALHRVAIATKQSTLEALQGDPVWNHIKFNARLLRLWLLSEREVGTLWSPYHHWYFEVPDGVQTLPSFDLREVMDPQALIVREWNREKLGGRGLFFFSACFALILGLGALTRVHVLARRADHLRLVSLSRGNPPPADKIPQEG